MGVKSVKIKDMKVTDKVNENVIEWFEGDKKVHITLSRGQEATKLKKRAERLPDIEILNANNDGSVYAKIPLSWITIDYPKPARSKKQAAQTEKALKTAHETIAKNSDN